MKRTFSALLLILFITSPLFAQCEFGAFVGNEDSRPPYASEIQDFESLADKHVASSLVYWSWADGDFPLEQLEQGIRYHDGYDTGTNLHLVWEPWARDIDDNPYTLSHIVTGVYDDYINRFARSCRDWEDPIRLRFAHEMVHDGDPLTEGWYPWQDQPELYKQAWNKVHSIFEQAGADNVEFVWAPNHHTLSMVDVNGMAEYYPGTDQVDWLGMDGYSWGYYTANEPWGYYLSFDEIFKELYQAFTDNPDIFGDKRMMIAEFAAAEISYKPDTSKVGWIEDAFNKIKNEYGELEAIYWFHSLKERDWRINSSDETLAAFQLAVSDPYFTSHIVPEPGSFITFLAGLLLFNIGKFRKKINNSFNLLN